jgi:hypothetical protein
MELFIIHYKVEIDLFKNINLITQITLLIISLSIFFIFYYKT